MEPDALIEILKRDSASKFLEEHIFDRVPTFSTPTGPLLLVGTNASQNYRGRRGLSDFGWWCGCRTVLPLARTLRHSTNRSDIDVAVVSHYHFTVAWRYLRQTLSGERVSTNVRIAWEWHVKRYIYWGTIAYAGCWCAALWPAMA